MYKIEIPDTIHLIYKIFHRMGMWRHNPDSSITENVVKMFYFIYYLSFTISACMGCYLIEDNAERVFLTVFLLDTLVLLYKMWYILSKNHLMLMMVHETGTHRTNDQTMFIQMSNNLNFLMKFGQIFMTMVSLASFLLSIVFPIVNRRRRALFINLALPLDKTNEMSYWIANVYIAGGIFCATVMTFFAVILWYIMFNFVIAYKLLGSQLRDMGSTQLTVSTSHQLQLYHEDILRAILAYDKINGNLEQFALLFSNLFLLQIATSSVCICGMVYSSAFSTHEDLVKDGVYFIILSYSFFDIFMIMYMGNEIKLSSEELSYRLFESNWIPQTKSSRKCVLIFKERLKKQQQLIVSKIYVLNLSTFTLIVNTAYRMFNLLQNFREK